MSLYAMRYLVFYLAEVEQRERDSADYYDRMFTNYAEDHLGRYGY